MIIGIDASRANKKEKTGTEWYAFNIIQEFKKIAFSTDQFILYSPEPLQGELGILPNNFSARILNWPPKFLWTQLRLSWEMLFHQPDILFVPAHTIPLICPKKTITTLHDVGFEEFKELYSQKSIGPQNKALKFFISLLVKIFTFGKYNNTELDYHRWSTRMALKKASLILTVSQFSQSEIEKHFPGTSNKIKVIYNGYNKKYRKISDFAKLKNVQEKYQLRQPFFVYIGRLEEKKNITGLITGFNIFKTKWPSPYQLVLVGTPGYGYDKIKEIIKSAKISHEIKEIGWIETEHLISIMNLASAFVFPTLYEGFGVPIIEAMACGTPVITSKYGSTKEIGDNAADFINPKDSQEIANAMHKISTDQLYKDQLIKDGYKCANKFSWQKTAQEIMNNLKQL